LTANFLREIQEAPDFLGQKWYESLKTVASNSSALGFAVEHMTISWISMYGFSKLTNGITQENQSPLPQSVRYRRKTLLFAWAEGHQLQPQASFIQASTLRPWQEKA
jgi:hypothetical protein